MRGLTKFSTSYNQLQKCWNSCSRGTTIFSCNYRPFSLFIAGVLVGFFNIGQGEGRAEGVIQLLLFPLPHSPAFLSPSLSLSPPSQRRYRRLVSQGVLSFISDCFCQGYGFSCLELKFDSNCIFPHKWRLVLSYNKRLVTTLNLVAIAIKSTRQQGCPPGDFSPKLVKSVQVWWSGEGYLKLSKSGEISPLTLY